MIIDKLRTGRSSFPPQNQGGARDAHAMLSASSKGAVVVLAQNVADYFWLDGRDGWSFSDFPNIAPPFPEMWIEYTNRWELWGGYDAERLARLAQVPRRCGVMVVSERVDSGWTMACFLFVERDGRAYGPLLASAMRCDGDGAYVDGSHVLVVYVCDKDDPSGREVGESLSTLINPAMLAVSMMHCKNVSVSEVAPPAPLSAKHEKRHGLPMARFRVLNIEPFRAASRAVDASGAEVPARRAMHICRGHFKTYGAAGLFGKYKGTYWWPQSLRGDGSAGAVVKQYNVKP